MRQTRVQIANDVSVPRGSLRDHGVVSAWRGANFLLHYGIPTTCRVIPAWTRGVMVRCLAVDALRPLENICTVKITGHHSSSPTGAKIKRHRSVFGSFTKNRRPQSQIWEKKGVSLWRKARHGQATLRDFIYFKGIIPITCWDIACNMERVTQLKNLRLRTNVAKDA